MGKNIFFFKFPIQHHNLNKVCDLAAYTINDVRLDQISTEDFR
jgi:hypothetical protein